LWWTVVEGHRRTTKRAQVTGKGKDKVVYVNIINLRDLGGLASVILNLGIRWR
jgi:hypothetical protein